ncbi:Type II secretion system protein K [uncultured bacterium]|nr:Type II secretion system protein K [uncultured bacterium]
MRKYVKKRYLNQSGVALVAALLVTAILLTLVTDFTYRMYIGSSRAGILKDSVRAGALATDGVVLAKAGLEELLRRDGNLVMDRDGLVFSQPAGEGLSVEIRAVDEAGKLSMKAVYPLTGLSDPRVEKPLRKLVKDLKLEDALVDSMADWIDNDDVPRPGGAEVHQYGSGPRPYKPRNNHLEALDELLLVKGFKPDVFMAVSRYLTPYGADGLVNINTAPKEVLAALSDEMTGELADRVIKKRKEAPFRDRSDIMKVPGFERVGFGLQDRITTVSRTYRVFSRATAGESVREVEAVIQLGGGVLYWRET